MNPVDFVLHFDKHLLEFVRDYGSWVYAILFTIVFAETGFVVTPFLPGDSLLFAAGALCATGELSLTAMLGLLAVAAFTGNAVNYSIGRFIGPKVFTVSDPKSASDTASPRYRLLNRDYLDRAHAFFESYGGKAIVLGRFVPIVRTFVPFVAGAAQMTSGAFVLYNAVGAVAWVSLCLFAGWFFGNIPIVKNNFSLVTIGIVLVSLLPMAFEYIAHRRRGPGAGQAPPPSPLR
jgi:membrane-associated protein